MSRRSIVCLVVAAALGALASTAPAYALDAPTLTKTPDRNTRATSAYLYWQPASAAAQCSLDDAPFTHCSGGVQSYAQLGEGQHTFRIRLVSGQETGPTATFVWRVDQTVPAAPTLTETAAAVTKSRTATFRWTTAEPDGRTECALVGYTSERTDCTGATQAAYTDLADGHYKFEVRQTDAAGNTSPYAEASFEVDTVAPPAPTLEWRGGPLYLPGWDGLGHALVQWTLAEPGGRPQCTLNGQTFEPCRDAANEFVGERGFSTYVRAPRGDYTFSVAQADNAGNVSAPATYSFRVTDRAPAPPQPSGKVKRTRSGRYTFNARSSTAAYGRSIRKYRWVLGRKTISRNARFTYRLKSGRTHRVKLTVTDSQRQSATTTIRVKVPRRARAHR